MATVTLTKETFEQNVNNSSIAVLDFWAPWCGPCKAFAPTFEEVSNTNKHDDILFGKINTEQEQELAAHFNIRSIPTLMIIRENVIVFSQAGALPKSGLEEVIKNVKALDMEKIHAEVAQQKTA